MVEPVRRTPPVTRKLDDQDAEIVRQNHEQRLREREAVPEPRVVRNVTALSGQLAYVAHGLGREPLFVGVSAVRWDHALSASLAVGVVIDHGTLTTDSQPKQVDRTQGIFLGFLGFTTGTPIQLTVDVLFL